MNYESVDYAPLDVLLEAHEPMEWHVPLETLQSKSDPQVFLDRIPVRLRTLVNGHPRSTTWLKTLGIWHRRSGDSTASYRRVWESILRQRQLGLVLCARLKWL